MDSEDEIMKKIMAIIRPDKLENVKDSLEKIWNHHLMKKLRKIKPNNLKGVCKKCQHLSFCMGGCRARAFIEYGNFEAPNPLCQSFYNNSLFPKKSLKGKNYFKN